MDGWSTEWGQLSMSRTVPSTCDSVDLMLELKGVEFPVSIDVPTFECMAVTGYALQGSVGALLI